MRVKLEIWMALGKELCKDFNSPSKLRSELKVDVEEGITVKKLFSQLAGRYPPIGDKIFDSKNEGFYSNVVVTFNDRVINRYNLYEKTLRDGDKIRILPVHAGG